MTQKCLVIPQIGPSGVQAHAMMLKLLAKIIILTACVDLHAFDVEDYHSYCSSFYVDVEIYTLIFGAASSVRTSLICRM